MDGNNGNDGDLMSIVRSCSKEGKLQPLTFAKEPLTFPLTSLLPPPPPLLPLGAMGGDEMFPLTFSDLSMNGPEDLCVSSSFAYQQPAPMQQQFNVHSMGLVDFGPQLRKKPMDRSKKRKKNKQHKLVREVPAESSMTSDKWAWRKYGQKPIKDSPFPRSYYRCSTSKTCPAKKQVEKSCSNPNMFILSYTEEHNHPLPTHRSALAGSTRSKPNEGKAVGATQSGLSPTTPLSASPAVSLEEDEEEEVEMLEEMLTIQDEPLLVNDDLSGAANHPAALPAETPADFDALIEEITCQDELLLVNDSSSAATHPVAPAEASADIGALIEDDQFFAKLWS